MRTSIFTTLVLLALLCSGLKADAKILRIGYWGTPISSVDYATADLAVTAATGGTATTSGDTIMVYGQSGSTYWDFNNLNKKLVILGSGYFHFASSGWTNFNDSLQNYKPQSYIYITFRDGSDGTTISGCHIESLQFYYVTNSLNNIKINNCYVTNYFYFYSNNNTVYDNWEISRCYFQSYFYGDYNGNIGKFSNLKLFNCIFFGTTSGVRLTTTSGQFGIIENCNFIGGRLFLNSNAFIIQNCIFSHSYSNTNYSASTFNNCVFDNVPSPAVTGSNNISSASNANLYAAYPTQGTFSNDARFKLKVSSPAIGVGINGVDCGAFGGVNPYKLSGIPAIPAVYKLTAPGSSANSNPYTITFSIRSNN